MDEKIAIVKKGLTDKINYLLFTEEIKSNMDNMIVAHIKTPMTISMNHMMEIAKEVGASDVEVDAKGACKYTIIFKC
jgi:hypothetical protein